MKSPLICFGLFAVTLAASSQAQPPLSQSRLEATPNDNLADAGLSHYLPQVLDKKTSPGINCHHYSTGTSLAVEDLKYLSYALTNGSDYTNTVVCPIIRDNSSTEDGLEKVKVQIYNPTAGVEFECQVNSYGKYGVLVSSGSDSTTLEGTRTLKIDVPASEDPGYYVLTCYMPPVGDYTSKIYAYEWQEYARTDDDN